MAIQLIPANSLIIPMDETYQNNGMWTAYGLVYALLKAGIPVMWAIQMGKPYDGVDFVASAQDFQTGTPVASHAYTGGPFIIDAAYASIAGPIIQAWQAAHPNTKVHRATSVFSADIAVTLNKAPLIAVEETNSGIIISYLNAAGIPDSNGNPWPNSSPDIFDADEVGAGALFGFLTPAQNPCRKPKYDIFLSPHTSDGTWTDPVNAGELDDFIRRGGNVHALCHSISAIENIAGPFLTTTGFSSFGNKGDSGTFTVDVPDYPVDQAITTSGKVQVLPGGSEQTWLHTSVTYLPTTQVLAHFLDNGVQYDFMIGGAYKGGTGAGKVFYEGGHQYAVTLPYSNNAEGPYLRFVYNSILWSIGKPKLNLVKTPASIPIGVPTTINLSIVNQGASTANGADMTVSLAPWLTYNGDANITPAINPGPPTTLTWSAAALGDVPPGTVVTFSASGTAPALGTEQIATYMSHYSDNYDESYTYPSCESINVTAGAVPSITKSPATSNAFPNQNVTWTIVVGNTGPASLNNITVTDTIPAGLAFVSAIPAPSSITPEPGGTTLVTWNIPGPIPPNSTISATVLTPPATTANFTNNVSGIGYDPDLNQYVFSGSAILNVVDRPPTVQLITPTGGEISCGSVEITWSASDPDGDPLTITLEHSSDGGVTFNTIAAGIPNSGSYTWDASLLPSGTNYVVRVTASDGQLTGSATSGTFTIDNTPPSVGWITPVNGQLVTGTVTLEATASDNVAVDRVDFYYSPDGINWTLIGSSVTPVGPWTQNWETSGPPALNGLYYLRAVAYDECEKSTEAIITVTVDNTPPMVQITNPPDGSVVHNTTPLTITASDNECLDLVELYIDGLLVTTVPASGTSLTFNYDWITNGYTDGPHTVTAIAYDCVGLSSTTENTYLIQNAPPIVNLITPAAGDIWCDTVEISWTATDPNQRPLTITLEYSTNGGATWALIDSGTALPNPYLWDVSLFPSGTTYQVRVTADNGINTASDVSGNFTIDTTAPTVSWMQPLNGQTLSAIATLQANASDNVSIDRVEFEYSVDGVNYLPIGTVVSPTGPWTTTWNTLTVSDGDYFLRAAAFDQCNRSSAAVIEVSVDNTPPQVQIVNPPDGSAVNGITPVTITASDNQCLSMVEVFVDGVLVKTVSVVGTSTTFDFIWDTNAYSEGPHSVTATATDCQGLQSTTSNTYLVQNAPPVVELLTPQAGDIYCTTAVITWTASDPYGRPLTTTLEYSPDGGATWILIASGNVSNPYIWDVSSLPSGSSYKVRVSVTNGITSATAESGTFTIDTTPPAVQWITPSTGDILTGTVVLSATASDNLTPIDSVEFAYSPDGVNFAVIGTVTSPTGPWTLDWDTATVPDGTYTLRALARNECGLMGQALITVTIDNTPPQVEIVSPPDGSTVMGTTELVISASDNECLSRVELYIDGQLVKTVDNIVGTDVTFTYDWDTTQYNETEHVVKAIAYDCAGLTAATENTYVVDNLPDHYVQVLIDDNLKIPEQKPDAERINEFNVCVTVTDIKVFPAYGGPKLLITGKVDITVLYVAAEPTQSVHAAHYTLSFKDFLKWPGLNPCAELDPVIRCEFVNYELIDPRTIAKQIVLFIGVRDVY